MYYVPVFSTCVIHCIAYMSYPQLLFVFVNFYSGVNSLIFFNCGGTNMIMVVTLLKLGAFYSSLRVSSAKVYPVKMA